MTEQNAENCILLKKAIYDKDKDALAKLHSIYYPNIKRFISSRVGLPDVEDLTQNLFLELCKGNSHCKEYKNAEAYLLGIAKNLVDLHYRNQGKQKLMLKSLVESTTGGNSDPSKENLPEKVQLIKDLIKQLPPKAKEAIKLRLRFGTKAVEKAGCSREIFYRRLYEGLKLLKEKSKNKNLQNL